MNKDQFDTTAEWLVIHLATWDALRRGFPTVESSADDRTRAGIIAAFLRDVFWNQSDISPPRSVETIRFPLS